MSREKIRITSKKELETALDFIVIDNWLDYPAKDPNVTMEEHLKQYHEDMLKLKMKILKADYDICIEDDKE